MRLMLWFDYSSEAVEWACKALLVMFVVRPRKLSQRGLSFFEPIRLCRFSSNIVREIRGLEISCPLL
jgi:hypothetical protein